MLPATLGMIATLIGLFVTPGGIVVGADTAVSSGDLFLWRVQKYCETGSARIATLQGQYFLAHSTGFVQPFELFKAQCAAEWPSGVTVDAQARQIAEALRGPLEEFARRTTTWEFQPYVSPDPHLNYISVVGYEGESPVVSVWETRARWRPIGRQTLFFRRGRWEIFIRRSNLSFRGCGASFNGEEEIITRLRLGDPRLPVAALKDPDIVATKRATGDCANWTPEQARESFIKAVALTNELSTFKLRPMTGLVRAPLDIVLVTPAGNITKERTAQ